MSVEDILDALRRECPGCVLAAYGDRTARLVLRTSAKAPWRQEHLDALCAGSARALAQAEALTAGGPDARPVSAIVASPQDIRLFVGAGHGGGDVLCCVLETGSQTGDTLDRAKAALSQLSGQAA